MALAAKLQLRQSQALVMTPQLMQSIRLLQFTHAELERFIDDEIERNPLLERRADEDDRPEPEAEPPPEREADGETDWLPPISTTMPKGSPTAWIHRLRTSIRMILEPATGSAPTFR